MKCTRNLHAVAVLLSIRNEHIFCSRRVYFSADSNSTYKTILNCSSIKRKTKKITVNFKGTAIYLQLQFYMPCVFYTGGRRVCLWIDRRSHIWFFYMIFFTSLEMFLYIKKNKKNIKHTVLYYHKGKQMNTLPKPASLNNSSK